MNRSKLVILSGAVALAVASVSAQLPPQPYSWTTAAPKAVGNVKILPVRDNIFMLVGPGGNVTVQVGSEGVFVIDTMTAEAASDVLGAIQSLSPKAIRWVVNTHSHKDHSGGNATVASAGKYVAGGNTRGGTGASILAYENALMRMNGSGGAADALPNAGWPTDSYFVKQKDMFFNGEPVLIIHPAATGHTDGDSVVFFRRSDVIAAGDLYTPDRYPFIDLAQNGTINGVLDGINYILELAVPEFNEEGGTMIIPGHGRLSDESDVSDYRDMVTIVRDRVKDAVSKKRTLEQIKAARLTMDYDGLYGRPEYTGDMFVEAIYKNLAPAAPAAAPARAR